MSNSSEFSETAAGGRSATPEKSSFSMTCNRLREYLKEKGSLGEVSLGIALAGDNGVGISPATAPKSETLDRSISSMNLFPQGNPKAVTEDPAKVGDYRCSEIKPEVKPEKAQMTIFYGGQVIVFNDMSASKAMEVMRLASIAASQGSGTPAPIAAGMGIAPQETITKIAQPILRNIPIARKQSLARFLEKRKDRIMARSPYASNNLTTGGVSLSVPVEKSWLGLAGL